MKVGLFEIQEALADAGVDPVDEVAPDVVVWAVWAGGNYISGRDLGSVVMPEETDSRAAARRLVTEWRLAGCPTADG